MKLLNSLAIALAMYSRIPVPTVEWKKESMKYAMCFFPLVGTVIGLFVYLAAYMLSGHTKCGDVFFAAMMFLIPVLVTGGIHLDGLADTLDAVSSYGDREKKLEILKDPHIGAFGVIGLCCYFAAGLAIWTEADMSVFPAAAFVYTLSRSLSGLAVVTFPAAKNSGLLRTFQDGAQKKRVRTVLLIWTVVTAAVMICLGGAKGIAAVAVALIVYAGYYFYSKRDFGGITGDLAGCFLQICELAMTAALIVAGGSI